MNRQKMIEALMSYRDDKPKLFGKPWTMTCSKWQSVLRKNVQGMK